MNFITHHFAYLVDIVPAIINALLDPPFVSIINTKFVHTLMIEFGSSIAMSGICTPYLASYPIFQLGEYPMARGTIRSYIFNFSHYTCTKHWSDVRTTMENLVHIIILLAYLYCSNTMCTILSMVLRT